MKKTIYLFLALVLCISLCACKDKAVQTVDDLILSIGEGPYNHEDVILQAEAAYDALSEKQKAKVENAALLESIRESYEQNRKEYFDAALSTIEDFFKAGDMELAESLCYDVLNNEQTPPREDEIPAINEWLNQIYGVCFAGTYIAMPQYVVDTPLELSAPQIKSIQSGGFGGAVCATCDFDSEAELTLATKQYRRYLDKHFEYVDSTYYPGGSEEHLYDYVRLNTLPLDEYSSLQIWMSVGLFDLSKIDTSNPDLTVADVDTVVIKE